MLHTVREVREVGPQPQPIPDLDNFMDALLAKQIVLGLGGPCRMHLRGFVGTSRKIISKKIIKHGMNRVQMGDDGLILFRMKRTTPRKLFYMLPCLKDPYKIQKHVFLYDFGFGFDPQTVQKMKT